jgi:hypothetical protein
VSVIAGCSGKTTDSASATGHARATLRRATSCTDLAQSLKLDALQKMNKAIDAQIRSIEKYGYAGGGYGYAYATAVGDGAPVPKSAGAPENADDASGVGTSASSFSETNTQVAGVDEADIVKTDGKYIYLLHGQKLEVLTAWPAQSLAESSAVDIEGEPTEMFQWQGKIVVYSRVDGTPIYSAANLTPRANYRDYGLGGGVALGGPDIAPGAPYPGGGWFQNPLTKITVIDLDGASTSVSRELYFEGSYLSSRRIDAEVRTVLQGSAPGPQIKLYPETPAAFQNVTSPPAPNTPQATALAQAMIGAYESLRSQNVAIIQGSQVTDWIPYTFTKTAAGISASSLACEDFYLPTPGTTQYGLTQVETFDAADASSNVKTAAIVGQADTVYSNDKTMILAARGWIEPELLEAVYASSGSAGSSSGSSGSGGAPVSSGVAPPPDTSVGTRNVGILDDPSLPTNPPPPVLSMDSTHLHEFDIGTDPTNALYVGSGSVPGTVANQFAIDERNGTLRVSTTERLGYVFPQGQPVTTDLPRSVNHVFALEDQAGALTTVGSAGDLAPGESIMSTRFVGDVAYVVTYLQKDPLFVVDLHDPHAPRVLGQLSIPGFSTYMHPIDDTHLLTIGQDNGLALQIFDVSDPTAPRQTHKFVYANEYGYSEAQSNHKAFTYYPERQLLAFPYIAYGSSTMKSTLELFKIDVANGIDRVGSVDHTSFFGGQASVSRGYCGGYYEPSVRRGVFLDDVIYSISYGGVIASDATTLAPLGSFALPQPQLNGYPGCSNDPKVDPTEPPVPSDGDIGK